MLNPSCHVWLMGLWHHLAQQNQSTSSEDKSLFYCEDRVCKMKNHKIHMVSLRCYEENRLKMKSHRKHSSQVKLNVFDDGLKVHVLGLF